MSEYKVTIDPKWNKEEIILQIKNEEVGASEFLSNLVVNNGIEKINEVKFRTLGAGQLPPEFKLQIGAPEVPPPIGFKTVWNGQFMIEKKPVEVTFYRHK